MMFLLFIRFAFFLMIAIALIAFWLSWSHGESIHDWLKETVEYYFTDQTNKKE